MVAAASGWGQRWPEALAAGAGAARPEVLVVEDEAVCARLLAAALARIGCAAHNATTLAQARASLRAGLPDLIILDLTLPDGNGLDLCAEVRVQADVPIIVHTGSTLDSDRALAQVFGACDYLCKPASLGELAACVARRLRERWTAAPLPLAAAAHPPDGLPPDGRPASPPRGAGSAAPRATGGPADGIYRAGPLCVDLVRRVATAGGRPLDLTRIEWRLLAALARQAGAVVLRGELMREVWGFADDALSRTMDVHVRHLRAKLAALPAPQIVTTRGEGHRLVAG